MSWLQRIIETVDRHGAAARAVIVATSGPTPRAVGASMLIWPRGHAGKIGRAEVEARVLEVARRLCADVSEPGTPRPEWRRETIRLATGEVLGERTGGTVDLLVEVFGRAEAAALARQVRTASDGAMFARPLASGEPPVMLAADPAAAPSIWQSGLTALTAGPHQMLAHASLPGRLDAVIERIAPQLPRFQVYGSGLVARALVKLLTDLPYDVLWLDSLPGHFPDAIPPGVVTRATADLAGAALAAGPGAYHAVMTAAHDLDLAVCSAVLRAGGFAYLGVIGSRVKRERLLARLATEDIAPADLARLACPIGVAQIRSKAPAVIAVGIAAEALAILTGGAQSRDGSKA